MFTVELLSMKSDDKIEAELVAILGPAKYYIDTPVSENDEHSYWFPTIGDSMTDGTERSIPNRSFVLARWLRLNSVKDVPLNRPIVIIIHYSSEQFCLLKSVAAVHEESTDKEICLRSYNSRCDDLWVPLQYVKFIFVVEKVRLPNGIEFMPA
jgi:hypothetical protein